MSVKIKQEVTSKYKAKTNTDNNFTLVGILEKTYTKTLYLKKETKKKPKKQELQIIIKSQRKQKHRDHDW